MITASKIIRKRVNLGRVVITAALARHRNGDWGDVCKADQTANDTA